jgi:glycosyltransferase involved in cell wall biosynthesis
MKILIVSFWFPPSNRIGAIRVGKLARYLDLRGHQTRVLTTDIIEDRSLPLEIPREHVYAEYRRRVDWLDPVARLFRRQPATGTSASREILEVGAQSSGRSAWDWLQLQYYGLIHIPDERAEWIKIAVPAGRRLIEEWRPDIIFASGPPFTGLFVAGRLGRAFNIPWVADFRDLWVDNPYYGDSEPRWRRPVDIMLERLIVGNAAALVTVSPNWAQQLSRRHRKAAEVVYNGYAKEDFPEPSVREDQGDLLTIRYTGSIYPGFRDPSPVFAAIGLLEDPFRNRVMVEFFGRSAETVLALAAQHRVRDRVAAWSPVPYRCALELQMEADILLLLQWGNKRDEGNLPGKIFEYLHARRPILLVGYDQGIAASLIRERSAGLVSSTPERIRDQLQAWLEDKRAGRLKRLDPSVSRGLSRDDQFLKLEHLFAKIVNERGVTTTATTPTIAWGGVDKSCQRMRHRRSRFPGSDEPSGGGGSTDS